MRIPSLPSFALSALFLTLALGCSKAAPPDNAQSSADQTAGDDDDSKASASTSTSPTTPAAQAPKATDANPVVVQSPTAGPGGGGGAPTAPAATTPPPAATTPPPAATTPPPAATTPPVVTPQACSNGGVHEVEDNGTAATATDLGSATSLCGSVAAAGDVDSFSFTLPANATSFSWSGSFSLGGSSVTFTANGVTTAAGQAPPWAPGQLYVVQVTGTQALDYSITLNIGQ